MNARDTISKQIFKEFWPKEIWDAETYNVFVTDKNGKKVKNTDGSFQEEKKYISHDVAELLRSVADLIDPINSSVEKLKEEFKKAQKELEEALEEQRSELANQYNLDDSDDE